jgi:hypothetical protein
MARKRRTSAKKTSLTTALPKTGQRVSRPLSKAQVARAKLRGEVIDPREFTGGAATWRIFRIMAEFVDGYEFLSKLEADVTVFGSARTTKNGKYYKEAVKLAELMAKAGMSIITGGGPGIMEAANKGAYKAGGESIGLNIQLPFEQRINKYVRHGLGFHFFFTRKVMLTSPSQVFVAFPGGFGTMDEVFEVMTLIQTHKMQPVPVILVGRDFWGSLAQWMEKHMVQKQQTISPEDMKIFHVVDTAEEAMKVIRENVTLDPKKINHRHPRPKGK